MKSFVLKPISVACVVGALFTVGYHLCGTIDLPDFTIGMVTGITALALGEIITIYIGD